MKKHHMARYRSILSFILVIVATFLVSCGGPTTAKAPPTYTAAQIEQVQEYVPKMLNLRDRLTQEVPALLNKRDWTDISNFVHGPMGELRLQLTYVTRNLLPQDQQKARQLTRDFFDSLVKIDQAARSSDIQKVASNYKEALADLDGFLQLIPQPRPQPIESEG